MQDADAMKHEMQGTNPSRHASFSRSLSITKIGPLSPNHIGQLLLFEDMYLPIQMCVTWW